MRLSRFVVTLLLACGSVCAAPGQQAYMCTGLGKEPWRKATQSPECRTLEVIHSMSLTEKLERLDGTSQTFLQIDAADGPNGIARGPFPGRPHPMALGLTAFPNEINVAATWDRDLAAQFGTVLAEEWRGKGLSEIIGPTLNMMRTWHWRRSAESWTPRPSK